MSPVRACALAAAIVLWPLQAAAGDPASAREQLKIGYTLAQEGKCEEALPHLSESLRFDPKAITLINLADCEEKTGKLADAMGHWVDARSRAQTEGARAIEDEATARANALEPRLGRLTITLAAGAPKDVTVQRDGVALGSPSIGVALPVDPGTHTIVVRAKGRPDATIQVTLAEGEAKSVDVDAGPTPVTPAPAVPRAAEQKRGAVSPLVFVGFGVAAVGVAAGTITGLTALSAGSKAEKDCPQLRCSEGDFEDIESGRTIGTISTVSFILAGLGAAVGVYGIYYGSRKATPPKASDRSVGVSVSPTGIRGVF